MTFEEFQDYIEQHILDGWMENAEVTITSVRKNNGIIYKGLHIRAEQESVSPSIYLDDYYDYNGYHPRIPFQNCGKTRKIHFRASRDRLSEPY